MNKVSKFKVIIILVLGLAIITGVLIFYKLKSEKIVISINSETIILDLKSEKKYIDLRTLNSEKDIIVKKIAGNCEIKINEKEIKDNEEINLGKIDIKKDNRITVDVKDIIGRKHQFKINTLPSTFPMYDVQGESEFDGDYYTSTFSFEYDGIHYIFKLDKLGNIKYYKRTNMVSFDFKKQIHDNKIRYTYLEAVAEGDKELSSILPCDLVVLDENYNEIERINYLNKDGTYSKLENHTYIYLDENHQILTTYKEGNRIIDENQKLVECLIQEVKDGKVLWEFDSEDYPELYEYTTDDSKDYIHINSIEIDTDDGNIICSFRNIDAVMKLDRNTGKIIWILGGKGDEFGLTEKQKFSKQHSAIYTGNNTIMIYDNGNANKRSRILKIKLDEKNKRVVEYTEDDTELFAVMMGSIRVVDEPSRTHLICYGGGDYKKYSIEEINYSTNEVKFKFTFVLDRYMYNVNKIK